MATITGTNGDDTLHGSIEDDLILGLDGRDQIFCSTGAGSDPGDDTVFGGRGDDSIFGANGDDWLYGGGKEDFLVGNGGNDRLYGERHDDELWGMQGRDRLIGGQGSDTLWGGTGRDRFIYDNDEVHDDTITDFTQGDDKIAFKREALGVGGAVFIGTEEFSGDGHGEVRYRTGTGFTVVEFDNDGDASLDIRMLLDGAALTLTADDFVLG